MIPSVPDPAQDAAIPIGVLVIEDNPGDVDLVRDALERDDRQWEVSHVQRLSDGIAALGAHTPAVVLLDLSLPDAAGLEGVTQLRQVAPDVPLVVLTGARDAASGTLAVREGAQDYLVKGEIEGLVLARVLRYAIERHAQAQRAQLLAREQAARAVAEEARRRAVLLADASTAVASTLEERQALLCLSRALVPRFAECCVVERVDAGGCTKRLVVTERDGVLGELDAESTDPSVLAGIRASSARGPRVEEPPSIPEASWGEEARAALRGLELRSAVVVPLRVRAEAIGTLALATSGRYGPEDLLFAEEIARRAAGAVDSARLYSQALEAVQIRDDFLSIAGHELRSPLGSILLDSERLNRQKQSCPEELRRAIERIARCGERLHRLVEDLLDASRIRSGRFLLEATDVDLVALVREVADRLAPTIARAGSELRLVAHSSVHGRWDGSRIQQVVSNLLQNAARYGAGKPIEVVVEASGDVARLRVRDHGRGIDPRDQRTIFEQFSRTPRAKAEGLGLGLWIARGIIQAHGGSISVESGTGGGAEFRVELPRAGAPSPGGAGGKP